MAKKRKSARTKTILCALTWADTNMNQVARDTGFSVPYIKAIVDGERTGYEVRPLIAKACNKRVDELWPDTQIKHRRAA